MGVRVSAPTPGSTQAVGTAWVMSRHLLVAQAVAAALGSGRLAARAVAWDCDLFRQSEPGPGSDVVVILDDLDAPSVVEDVRPLVIASPAPVVVLTPRPPTHLWGGLLEAGVTEVIHGIDPLRDLEGLLVRIIGGEDLMGTGQRADLRLRWTTELAEQKELRERLARLSRREAHVLDLLAGGRRVAEIGAELGVSQSTVRSQVKSLRRKLGTDSQLGAVAILYRSRQGAWPPGPYVPRPRTTSD